MDLDDEELEATRKLYKKKDKIEVGEYIRLGNCGINKIIDIKEDSYFLEHTIEVYNLNKHYGDYTEIITTDDIKELKPKHSKNIIDLIEPGDYVNGHLVIDVYDDEVKTEDSNYSNYDRYKILKAIWIKDILTHEQYENNCHRLED